MFTPRPKFAPKRLPRQVPKVTVPSYIGESGQVGNWLFYNGAGGKLYDFSGKRNNGDIVGPKWVDGSFGWALDFDGSDDYVEIPDDPSLDIGGALTVLAWLYSNDSAQTGGALFKREGLPGNWGPNGNYGIEIADGNYGFTYFDGTSFHDIISNTPPEVTWHHFAGVYRSDGTAEVWIDGDRENYATDLPVPATNDYHLIIGAAYDSYWNGLVAGVRIYERALSTDEIRRHFESTRGIFGV